MMSTEYTQTLKSIKDAEESSNAAVAERKKQLEEKVRVAEEDAARAIAEAKKNAETLVASEVERARLSAQADAEKLLAATSKEASGISATKLSATELKKIMNDLLFSDFKGA